jgi:hypothetical protein
MRGAVILPAATVVGGLKNKQIYIIKKGSGKCNSRDLMLDEEHTAWRRKFKNFKSKRDLN